ncbi:Os08g0221300, partial [Oryza sativa Japonica Group]
TTPEPSKPRGRAPAFLFHLDLAAGREDDGRCHRHCAPRERRARRRCSGARTGRRHRVLIVVPTEPNHPKPNPCATRITSTSSSRYPKKTHPMAQRSWRSTSCSPTPFNRFHHRFHSLRSSSRRHSWSCAMPPWSFAVAVALQTSLALSSISMIA